MNNNLKVMSLVLGLAISFALCMQTMSVPVNATSPETPMIVGELSDPGDTATYEMQIDHSLYPDAVLYAFAYGKGTGNATISIYDENDSFVNGIALWNTLDDNSANTITAPKGTCYIRSTEATIKKYRVTVSTKTGNVGFAMNIGTLDTLIESFGGINNIATVSKNNPPKAAEGSKTVHFRGIQALLNDGEWFRYTADGYTYITAIVKDYDSLAFEVYDIDDLSNPVYRTTAANCGLMNIRDAYYEGYVQAGLELEKGKDYLIKFYSTSYISPTDVSDYYRIYIGNPFVTTYKFKTDTKTLYVPANTTKTFYINVPDSSVPASARAGNLTNVHFTSDSSTNNTYVTLCRITAPNGYTFSPINGRYSKFEVPSPVNFLSDPNHVPIRGTWKVTIRTSKALNFKFCLNGYCEIIVGKDGN